MYPTPGENRTALLRNFEWGCAEAGCKIFFRCFLISICSINYVSQLLSSVGAVVFRLAGNMLPLHGLSIHHCDPEIIAPFFAVEISCVLEREEETISYFSNMWRATWSANLRCWRARILIIFCYSGDTRSLPGLQSITAPTSPVLTLCIVPTGIYSQSASEIRDFWPTVVRRVRKALHKQRCTGTYAPISHVIILLPQQKPSCFPLNYIW